MPQCDRCNGRWFMTQNALEQHMEDSDKHHICQDCNKDFAAAQSLLQHYTQSPKHPYCERCDEHFDDYDDLYDHYDEDHYYCRICNEIYHSENGLHEHRGEEHDDLYCISCKRMFRNENDLRNHQRSALHQGRTIDCPMKGCNKSFVSRAALLLHLESGGCGSGMTRDNIDRIMRKLDQKRLITNPPRLIEGPQVTKTWATPLAWNGTHYECYLCHRTFASLPALNQHLDSPVHAANTYHCPTGFWRGCGEEFPTLSAFCQHVESERCGVARFREKWNGFIDGLPKASKRLT